MLIATKIKFLSLAREIHNFWMNLFTDFLYRSWYQFTVISSCIYSSSIVIKAMHVTFHSHMLCEENMGGVNI